MRAYVHRAGGGGGGGGVRKTEDFWEAYTQSTGPGVSCPSHTSIIRLTHKALGPGYHAPLTTQSSALHTKNWALSQLGPLTCPSHNSSALHTKHRARGIMPLSQLISFTHKALGPGYHAPLTTHQLYTQSTGPGVSCPSHNSIISFTHKAQGPGYHAPLTTQSSALHTKHRARGIMPLSQLNHQLYTQSTGPDPSGHSMAWHDLCHLPWGQWHQEAIPHLIS